MMDRKSHNRCRKVQAFAIFMVLISFPVALIHAQVKVSHVTKPEITDGKKGVFYSLPRTTLGIDIFVTRIEKIPGPFISYAKELMGIDDPVTSPGVEYSISGAEITTGYEPDSQQSYFIEKDEKSNGQLQISFTADGQIIGTGRRDEPEGTGFQTWDEYLFTSHGEAGIFETYDTAAMKVKIDTIVRLVTIDTLTIEQKYFKRSLVEQTDREKAEEAVTKISRIEQDRYNLITGYQETAYSKEALEFMLKQLDALKLDYISLFTGITMQETLKFSYRFLPDPEKAGQAVKIAEFSSVAGLAGGNGSGDIQVRITRQQDSDTLGDEVISAEPQGFAYRIPALCIAEVLYKERVLAHSEINVNQFGIVRRLPPDAVYVNFYPETGGVKNLILH